MTEPDDWSDTAITCTGCGTQWGNEASADACCGDDELTGYMPSRHRVSYRLSYD